MITLGCEFGHMSMRVKGLNKYFNNKLVNKYHEILVLMPHTYLYYMDRGTCTFLVGALDVGLHSHTFTLTRFPYGTHLGVV